MDKQKSGKWDIWKNGNSENPQNLQKWGERSSKWLKMGTKIPQNEQKWG